MARRTSETKRTGEIRIDISLPGDTWAILFDVAVRKEIPGAEYLRHVLVQFAKDLKKDMELYDE